MPYTVEDFKKETAQWALENIPPEERLKGLSPEDRLKGLRPEERMKGLRPEERLKDLTMEDRLKTFLPKASLQEYPLNEVAKSVRIMFPELSLEEIEKILKKMVKDS